MFKHTVTLDSYSMFVYQMDAMQTWLNNNVGAGQWEFQVSGNYPKVYYVYSDSRKVALFDRVGFVNESDMLAFILVWGGVAT